MEKFELLKNLQGSISITKQVQIETDLPFNTLELNFGL